jgi:hypothetical protein
MLNILAEFYVCILYSCNYAQVSNALRVLFSNRKNILCLIGIHISLFGMKIYLKPKKYHSIVAVGGTVSSDGR